MVKIRRRVKMRRRRKHFPDIGCSSDDDPSYSPSSAQDSDCDSDVVLAPKRRPSHHGLRLSPQPASGQHVQWVCALCDGTFSTRSNLQRHEQTVHAPDNYSWPHFCDTCSLGFPQKSDLKKHERIHTQERPYTCPECGKTFTQSSSLSRHRRAHTGVRPHICSRCGRSFTEASSLKRHLRGCRGKCSQACAVQFAFGIEVPKHSNSERNLQCPKCGKVFSKNSNLKRHCLKLHGMRSKHCPCCSKRPKHCNLSN